MRDKPKISREEKISLVADFFAAMESTKLQTEAGIEGLMQQGYNDIIRNIVLSSAGHVIIESGTELNTNTNIDYINSEEITTLEFRDFNGDEALLNAFQALDKKQRIERHIHILMLGYDLLEIQYRVSQRAHVIDVLQGGLLANSIDIVEANFNPFPALNELKLDNCCLSEGMVAEICRFPSLQNLSVLSIGYISELKPDFLVHLTFLQNLTAFTIKTNYKINQVNGEDKYEVLTFRFSHLGSLPQLTSLTILDYYSEDQGIEFMQLGALTNLQSLKIHANNIPPQVIEHLENKLENCDVSCILIEM